MWRPKFALMDQLDKDICRYYVHDIHSYKKYKMEIVTAWKVMRQE